MIGLETHYFFFFESLQLQVITSVILMSYANCDTFETTYNNLYAFEYVGGDFMMHYFPSKDDASVTLGVCCCGCTHQRYRWLAGLAALALGRYTVIDYDIERVTAQIWLGNALLLTWDYFHSDSPSPGGHDGSCWPTHACLVSRRSLAGLRVYVAV